MYEMKGLGDAQTLVTKAGTYVQTAEQAKSVAESAASLFKKNKKKKTPAVVIPTYSPSSQASTGLFGIPWMYVGIGGVVLIGATFFLFKGKKAKE